MILKTKTKPAYREDEYEKVCSLFGKLSFKVYFSRCETGEIGLIGSTGIENLNRLRNGLLSMNCQITDVNTPRYDGIYFSTEKDGRGFILSPKEIIISSEQWVLNDSREMELLHEVREFGEKSGIKTLAGIDERIIHLSGENMIVAEALDILPIQLQYRKYINTHREYVRFYKRYSATEEIFTYGFSQSAIETNCGLYHIIINAISGIYPGQSLSFHEIIDGVHSAGHLSLLVSSLAEGRTAETVFPEIHLTCAKTGWMSGGFFRKVMKSFPGYANFIYHTIEGSKEIHVDTHADVVVVSDFDDSSIIIRSLPSIWEKTNRLLIVHSNTISGKLLLEEHSAALTGATPLSHIMIADGKPLSDFGLFVVSRD